MEKIDGRVKVKDWDLAFDQFMLVHKPKGMTQKDYAALLDVTPVTLSVAFNEIERERQKEAINGKLGKLILKSLAKAEEALDFDLTNPEERERLGIGIEFQAKLAADMGFKAADRQGWSPQAMTLNLTQNNSNTIQAPIFASPYESEAIRMMEPLDNADKSSDS